MPVVALSAGDTAQDRLRARRVGMNDYLVKPFGAADLERITGQFVPADPLKPQIKENKFDLSLVEMASLGDPVFLVQLLNLFLDTTPAVVAQLQSVARGGDWATVAALAHKHRCFFTTLGLLELKEQLAALEESAREETGTNSENINILLFRFARDYESACAQVKGERDKLEMVDTRKE